LKDYFIYRSVGNYKLYDTVCISELSELNRKYDDSVRSKLYSAVILENKDKILQLKSSSLSFENAYKANFIYSKMEENLHYLCDELLCISEEFESEVITKICSERSNAEQIKQMQKFISDILDSNNNPQMKNIGQNEELKIKYIKLANFLLHFQGFSNSNQSFQGLSRNLKSHLIKIISLRNSLVIGLTQWIRFILGDLYTFVHQLEGVSVDQSFLQTLQIEYVNQQAITNLRAEYELLLNQKSERIALLEQENSQLKREFESYRLESSKTTSITTQYT
jgi:hypothetical protein